MLNTICAGSAGPHLKVHSWDGEARICLIILRGKVKETRWVSEPRLMVLDRMLGLLCIAGPDVSKDHNNQ